MKTLYEKIGAVELQSIVNRFYELVFESEIKHLFHNNPEVIRQKQFEFLTQFLGGPQLYSEKYGYPKMRMRHLPHRIDEKAKLVWLKCMRQAINESNLERETAEAFYLCFPKIADHMQNH